MEEVVVVNVSYFAQSAEGHLREFEGVSPRKIWKLKCNLAYFVYINRSENENLKYILLFVCKSYVK